ncbi:hypothetical protein B8P98_16960 [Klebsiella quasivariicola]|nr:hypothetical protein B8P98_16960 [Klebsiella quasivariicola]
MMSLWDALRMNMMISYQELVRTFLSSRRQKGIGILLWRTPPKRGCMALISLFARIVLSTFILSFLRLFNHVSESLTSVVKLFFCHYNLNKCSQPQFPQ